MFKDQLLKFGFTEDDYKIIKDQYSIKKYSYLTLYVKFNDII